MNRAVLIFLILIAGAVLLAVGFGVGIYYNPSQNPSQLQIQKAENLVKDLSSETVGSIVAYGQVSATEGRTITLTNGEDSLTIDLPDSAP